MADEKKKMGRPRKTIDWDMFDRLAYIQCTVEEISFGMGMSSDTIDRACLREREMTFAEYRAIRAQGGKISLRRLQWKAAEKGNAAVLIFMGKNILDQKDTPIIINKIEERRDIVYDIEFGSTFEGPTHAKGNS